MNFFTVIRRNRLYIALALFAVAMAVLSYTYKKSAARSEERKLTAQKAAEAQKDMFDVAKVKEREKKLLKLAVEKPELYVFIALANLALFFFILVGLGLDVYFIFRFLRRSPPRPKKDVTAEPKWTLADVARVAIIFISSGYAVVILQVFLVKLFPILVNENFRMVFDTFLMNVVGIGVMFYFIVKKYGQTFADVGLKAENLLADVFYAFVGFVSVLPVLALIMAAIFFVSRELRYQPPVQPIVKLFMEERSLGILLMSSVFAACLGPVAEEIFFRGFMQKAVKRYLGVFWSIALTSVVFSALHGHIVGFLPIMALSVVLGYLAEKTGSLVAPISMHVFYNLAMVVLVFMAKVLET